MSLRRRLLSCIGVAGLAAPLFAAAPDVILGGPEVQKLDWNTRALQAADLDGDGLNDLVVINNDRATIELLYQLKPGAPREAPGRSARTNRWEPVVEDARFRRSSLTTGVSMFDLTTGDLNGDGRPDLVYTGDSQALTIRYQQADRTWVEKKITEAPAPIQFLSGIRVADMNGDNRPDLVMLGLKEIALFYQDEKGELSPPERFALPDENCYGLELVDVNGDGRPDLVYLSNTPRDALRVRLQNAQRQFGPEQAYPIKPSRSTLQILAQGDAKTGASFVFAQNVTGQLEFFSLDSAKEKNAAPALRPRVFAPRASVKTTTAYAFGDFDGDGREDIAVSDPDGAQVFIYFRQPDGGFTGTKRFPSFSDARALAAGDWDGDGRVDLFIASTKEQAVGIASVNADGRLGYPQPVAITGRPLALAAGKLTERGPLTLVVLRDDKGKRALELYTRADGGAAKLERTIDVPNLKTDPRAARLLDANQDGRIDIAVFTPLDALRLFVQDADGSFADAAANAGFRKGLVDNIDSAAVSAGDIDGDGKAELLVSSGSFTRALRLDDKGALTVVDQFNARDTTAEISTALVLPAAKGAKPEVLLYDRKAEQFQRLRANAQGVFEAVDAIPVGKIEVLGAEVRTVGRAGQPELFVLGKDRFWWIPLGRADYTVKSAESYTTDLPDVDYADVIAGDLTADGNLDLVAVDPEQNIVEVLALDPATQTWESRLHFKVFETDEHYQGRKGDAQEPRETIIADVTGDKKKDLILLVHDRVLIYPQK